MQTVASTPSHGRLPGEGRTSAETYITYITGTMSMAIASTAGRGGAGRGWGEYIILCGAGYSAEQVSPKAAKASLHLIF